MSSSDAGNADASASPEELSFEEAFRTLAEISEKMEAGGLTLGDATAQFEQGMKLVQRCNQLLDSAELEITTLRESYQRSAVVAPAHDDIEPPYLDEAPYDEVSDDEDELPF